jgi:hypothetical protein
VLDDEPLVELDDELVLEELEVEEPEDESEDLPDVRESVR